MYKINFPNGRKFNGLYLSVKFVDGEAETESSYLAERFEKKGLIVEDITPVVNPFSNMKTAELEVKAQELEVDISDCKNNPERAQRLFEAILAKKTDDDIDPKKDPIE